MKLFIDFFNKAVNKRKWLAILHHRTINEHVFKILSVWFARVK